ncbi:hypothetical protein [Salmonella enterica]
MVCCDRPGENIESLISRADQAMRLAKKNGRDQVVVDASIA